MILQISFALLFVIIGLIYPFKSLYVVELKPDTKTKKFFKWFSVSLCNAFLGWIVGGSLEYIIKWIRDWIGG